jgi:sarcosine/dimethylglycine N-methyltransferase
MGPTKQEIVSRNHIEYDDAADAYWRRTVYDAVHDGWRFSCIGGRPVLDHVGSLLPARRTGAVLELCSGLGDTCAYLALRYRCRVTGIEMNEGQLEKARAHLRARPARVAGRVRFVRADVISWQPDRDYDAAFALDSLMLMEDAPQVARTAHRALRPGGVLVVADVLGGPGLGPELRRFCWEEDGIIHLPSPEGQEALLRGAGYREVRLLDRSRLAVRCFERMIAASAEHREELVAAKGIARYERWVANARVYLDSFRTRVLRYVVASARR